MTTKINIPSSSSSPPFRKLTYDVFLSFRGEDTRKNFTDHLYSALKQKGIFTFRDDEELERGESIAPNLLNSIEESRYAVVVFSRNYANSSWCLDEIAKIVECMKAMGQKVLPVFYDVDPYEVRHQTGDHFGKAFAKHQKRFEGNPDKVQRWKDALSHVANLSGWHVKDGYESKVIGEIVDKIFTELNQRISISEGLVGMDSHLKKVLSYLDIGGPDDVRIIGICGMGGIGKTTIAHVVSQRVKAQFEGTCFLENIREVIEKQGPVHLQEQLLSNLLKSNVNVQNIEMGKNIIKDRLCTKRVLIVLDDVDQDEQLEALCDREWFGPGSRIIITSRDDHLLSAVEGDEVYKVNSLSDEEALQLFRMKAFKKDQPVGEEFLKLSKEFLKYADGHPLAIKVLGSSVKGRSVELWSSALDRLKHDPEKKISNVLKLSFEGLRDTEKEIFLDIACFFKGHDRDRVTRILKGCDGPNIDIEVLIEKSMVTLFGRKLWMHDLIQTMGREIVRQQYPRKPEKRSRLWDPEEIIHVLDRSKATSAIQCISLQGPTKSNVVHSINDSFSNMDRLRVLKIKNVKFSGNIKYLSNELQYLEWNECPIDSFPSDFQPDNLVELLMYSSCIKQLWRGEKGWRMLRRIDLSGSQYLTSTPDFTQVPDLEVLDLEDCTSLVEVHPSLGCLKKLFFLNMRNCKSVECIPPFTSLESLKTWDLSLCSRLKKVPEIERNMKSLLELYLGGTSIEELPPSVECLIGLATLDLTDCKNLLHLPSTIQCLTSLKILNLTGCSKLEEIPAENQYCMECLEELYIGGTAITDLSFLVDMKNLQLLSCPGCKSLLKGHADPTSLLPPASLTCLIELDLSDCDLKDEAIPNDLSSLISLRFLKLGGNSFVRLPDSISQLSKLQSLDLFNCKQLQLLPKLASSCRYVHAQGCTSLTDFPNQYKELISLDSGVTTINSLDSSGRDSEHLISWRSGNGQSVRSVSRTDEHTEWKQVDQLSLPIPILMKEVKQRFDLSSDRSNSIWVGDEIPEWFRTSKSTSNPISIPIPPNLTDDNNWKGVAVCAVFVSTQGTCDFRPKERRKVGHTTTAVSVIESDSETCSYLYQCTLQTDVVRMKPSMIGWERRAPHLLMTSYVASGQFPKGEYLNESTVLAARFETNNPFMVVHECGIRLVYEQDAGWYNSNIWIAADSISLNEDKDLVAVMESGWLSKDQVDKRWKWEKFIPPMEEASTLVLRKNIESVLPRFLEALNHHFETYKFNISGSPAWFDYFNPSDTIMSAGSWSPHSFEIPQNLHKSQKWMGFAIYASIAEEVGHIIQEKEKDNYSVYFKLTTGGESTVSRKLKYIRSSEEHHQLLVVYIPRALIPEELFTRTSSTTETEMCISFKIDSPHVKLQTIGVRVVYQEDIQGFVETIIRCMQTEDSLEYYDKLVVENWIQLIRLQGGHLEAMSNPKERDPRTTREKKFELLSQKYRTWDWSTPRAVQCQFWGAEISKWKWFMHFKQGNSAEIQLPPNFYDDANWLGIAVCAFNRCSHEDPNMSVGSTTPDLDQYNVLTCLLDSDVDWAGMHDFTFQEFFSKIGPHGFAYNETWFLYIPRGVKCFSKSWRQCNLARATLSSSSPSLAVHSCALRLIYKEDTECLGQILTSCELP